MLLDGLDKIRHLPKERIHWLEGHWPASVRDTSFGPRPREPFADDVPRLAIEFHAIRARKQALTQHSCYQPQTDPLWL